MVVEHLRATLFDSFSKQPSIIAKTVVLRTDEVAEKFELVKRNGIVPWRRFF